MRHVRDHPHIQNVSPHVWFTCMGPASHVVLLNASPDESDMYAVWLELCGYRVTIAQSPAAARRIMRGDRVDVLVIDALFAPSSLRDGFERRWSRLTNGDCLAVVILSGYLSDAYSPLSPRARTVCAFKPCLPQQLSRCIEKLLSPPSHASIAGYKGKPLPGRTHP